jgi:transglutaminase-like putative cysteine protease
MKFQLKGHLAYQVNGPATIISSVHCMRMFGQEIFDESFITSRAVDYEELQVGLGQNRFSRITLDEPGELSLDYSATAVTSPRRVPRSQLQQVGPDRLSPEVIPFLFPSRYCQSDMFRDEAAWLFPNEGSVYEQVESVVTWISENVNYVSGSTDEQTSAVDVMNQRCGVCRDFAHLAIALCRALTIPARYATVYAYQLEPQDFHACFEVSIGGDWYLFDATSLVPLNGLVRISVGRDASDAAVASLFGNIQGTELSVSCEYSGNDFQAITRESLQNAQEAFILG